MSMAAANWRTSDSASIEWLKARFERRVEVQNAYLHRGTLSHSKQVTAVDLNDNDKSQLITDNY